MDEKKHRYRILLLRMLSSAAICSYIYAGIATLRTMLFSDDGSDKAILFYILCACLAFISGSILFDNSRFAARKPSKSRAAQFAAYMFGDRNIGGTLAAAAAWLMILIPAAAAFLICRQYGTARILFEIIVVIPAYVVPLRHSKKAPAEILSNTGLGVGLFILTVCLELPYLYNRLKYLRPRHFGVMYFLIFAYMIVNNYENIQKNIYNKKVEKSILPRNIRRFNTTMVCVMFALLFLLFNLKAEVLWLIDFAGKVIGFAVKGLIWIIGKIIPDTEHIGGVIPEGTTGPLPGMEAQPPSPLLNLVFNTVKYFLLLYLAYRLIMLIISKMPAIAAKLAEWARRLFGIRTSDENVHESEFIDITETIMPEKVSAERKRKAKRQRSVKKLKKIADPVQRIRYMYGLILDMLAMHGIMPAVSDTTSEIISKADCSEAAGRGLVPFTKIYDQVRYGEIKPDDEMLSRAEECFEGVCSTWERKK